MINFLTKTTTVLVKIKAQTSAYLHCLGFDNNLAYFNCSSKVVCKI